MITKSFSKLAAVAAILLIALLSVSSMPTLVHAQLGLDCTCPPAPTDDAQYDSTPIPWHEAYVYDTVNGCPAKICYCWRQTSSNNFDYCVNGICYNKFCEPWSGVEDSMTYGASKFLFDNNPQGYPCNPCPHGTLEWSENVGTCWHYDTTVYAPGDTSIDFITCPEHGWCVNAYFVCCDPVTGAKTYTYDRSVATTWQCKDGCTQITCPDIFGQPH